jgi:trimeric autotransporter adhesin
MKRSTWLHKRWKGAVVPGIGALAILLIGPAMAATPASTPTTTNQELTSEVSLDAASDPVTEGTAVKASARATLGEGDVANIVYVVDVSGSMENPEFNPFQEDVGNCDGDRLVGTALDSACAGLIALNASLGGASNVNVGLVAYGSAAKTADMDPASGPQTFTSPPNANKNANSIPDVEEVIGSLETEYGPSTAVGGIGLFTEDVTASFPGGTNYDAALTAMNAAFATRPATDINVAFFLSDGIPTTFTTGAGSPLQAAIDAGTTIHTFGIGGGAASACSTGASLLQIADATGGSCTEVADPSTLSAVLPATLTNIASLQLKVNSVVVDSVAGSEPVSMQLVDVDITSALVLGNNIIEAIATAADGTQVTASTTLEVIVAGDNTPPTVSCTETANPSGRPASPGFFQLLAEDDVSPAASLEMFVVDSGSGMEFGPFPVGTNIRYTKAPGATPTSQEIAGGGWRITGKGDPLVYAVDEAGNESSASACVVLPPPR